MQEACASPFLFSKFFGVQELGGVNHFPIFGDFLCVPEKSVTKCFIRVGLRFEHLGLGVFCYYIITNAKKINCFKAF